MEINWEELMPLLPTQVDVLLNDGTITELPVDWQEETYVGTINDLKCAK